MVVKNNVLLGSYATMAGLTYSPDNNVDPVSAGQFGTYTQLAYSLNDPNGFQARAFFNTTTRELVIAFTGTETGSGAELVPDFVADFSLAVAGASPQDAQARYFIEQVTEIAANRYGTFDVTYVGHSLGGFLAQTASTSGPLGEVVVFNSPGAGGFLGLPNSSTFPEDHYTYIYSDPSSWGFPGAPIHSIRAPPVGQHLLCAWRTGSWIRVDSCGVCR